MFLMQGAWDYMAARCCLLNGQLPGLALGQQAVEKTLKGLLYASKADYNHKAEDHRHHVTTIWEYLKQARPELILSTESYLPRFIEFYDGKYPDANLFYSGNSSNELLALDVTMKELTRMIPMNHKHRLQVGVYGILCAYREGKVNMFWHWMIEQNIPARALLEDFS